MEKHSKCDSQHTVAYNANIICHRQNREEVNQSGFRYFICYIMVQDGICLIDFTIWTGKDCYNKNAVSRRSGQEVGNGRTLFNQSWSAVLG
jgi:hypothetical protein